MTEQPVKGFRPLLLNRDGLEAGDPMPVATEKICWISGFAVIA